MDDDMTKMTLLINRLYEEGHDSTYIDHVLEEIIRRDCEKQGIHYDDVLALANNPSLAEDPIFLERCSPRKRG